MQSTCALSVKVNKCTEEEKGLYIESIKQIVATLTPSSPVKNRFGRYEWAGAFGDLGTLIPFVVAYITLLDMNPLGVLFAFGFAKILSGLYFTARLSRSSR